MWIVPTGYLTLSEAVLAVARGGHEGEARTKLEQALVSGTLRAAALREDGKLVSMPVELWRRAFVPKRKPRVEITGGSLHVAIPKRFAPPRFPFDAARKDEHVPIAVTPAGEELEWGIPLLAAADLARWCGAPPDSRPAPPAAPDAALAWMQRHALGRKRDTAIADCQRATGVNYRAARNAWGALPPEVRGTRGARKRP